MIETALGEGLAGGEGSKMSGETEGVSDREVSLDVEEGSSHNGFFGEDDSSSLREALVDTVHDVVGGRDIDEVDGLLESGGSSVLASVEDSSSSGDDLSTTSVDGIGMKLNIEDVEFNTSHGFLSEDSFLGGPLESGFHVVLDFTEVLDGGSFVNKEVGAAIFRAEGPDLSGLVLFPLVFVDKESSEDLGFVLNSDDLVFDVKGEFLLEGLGSHVQLIVLVGGLGQASLAGDLSDSFLVGDYGVGLDDFDVGVLLNEILQADFQMEFTTTGDDVLVFSGDNLDHRVGLGHLLETIDKLG